MKGSIKIDSHRLTPNVWFLFPDHPFVGRADTVVAYKDLNRPQPLLGICNSFRTALYSSEICHRIFETCFFEFLLAACDAHHPSAA